MRPLRSFVVGSIGIFVASVVCLQAGPARADRTINDCFAIGQAEKDSGVDFELANACDRSISCQMTWTVQCESAAGKASSRAEGRAGVMLARGEKQRVFGSAGSCNDHAGWTIDNVRVTCAPVR